MATLWQILTGQYDRRDVEDRFYNPLGIRIDNRMQINSAELEIQDFTIKALAEVTRHVGDQTFVHADYILMARPLGGEVVKKKMRLIPLEEKDGEATHSAILLNLLDDFEYNEDFHKGLAFDQNQGQFQEGDATYWRVNDQQEPWECTIKSIADLDGDGKAEMSEVRDSAMTYWDFWRETLDEAQNKTLEFYIVEMSNDTGRFQIWRGGPVDQHRIEVA